MSAPAWFDKDVYLANKLAQLQADEPNNGWDMLKMAEAFNNAGFNPFTDDGIYAHFVAFGNAEGISPNAYFDEGTYFTNKLAQLQATEPDKGWTSVDQVKEAFADAGLSAWDHYTLYGAAEGVSPSEYFDTNAYMQAKLAQMQADDPAYTMTQLQQAFKDADLNPIEHYILFGKDENLSYTPYPVDTTDPNKKIVELANSSTFYIDGAKEPTDVLPSGDYTLIGNAQNLADASYTIVAGAKGDVVLKDDVATLVALGADVKEALGLASKVTVEGSLNALMNAELPSQITAKSVSYLVTAIDPVTLDNVTVAQAVNAQADLDTFLANPYVDFDGQTVPDSLKVTVNSIEDTVANLTAADLTQFDDATLLYVKDTAANIDGMTLSFQKEMDKISVSDSITNILDMDAQNAVTGGIFVTDTKVSMELDSGDAAFLSEKSVSFVGVADDEAINITLKDSGGTFNMKDFVITEASGVTFDVTGTTGSDTISAATAGGTIDGNGGNDTIVLNTGNDNVAFDKWAPDASVTITGFEKGKDTLDFSGNDLLNFDFSKAVDSVASNGSIASDTYSEGGVFFIDGASANFNSETGVSGLFDEANKSTFAEGTSFLVVTNADTNGTYVWYVEASDTGTIGTDEIHLVAHLADTAGLDLTAADFGVTGA